MRITGGQAKGRLLSPPRGLHIRPSSDRVREAIFNLLGQDLEELKVLDLFAGTGALGLEALSRGAVSAVFVDRAQQSIKLIRKNLELCRYQDRAVVLKYDLSRGVPRDPSLRMGGFDLVFLDPPYQGGLVPSFLQELLEKGLLSKRARVVAESSKFEAQPVSVGNLRMTKTRTYGDTRISIYSIGVEK